MATSIADLFVSVTSDVSGALTGLTSVDQKVNGTSSAMAAAAPAGYALAAAAGAVGAGFISAVSVASDFEHQINGIKSVMSPAEVQTYGAAVEDLALKLGKDTTFSASQAAAAIEELIKAGVPLPAILNGGARSALDLASATGTDVTLAAGLAATAMMTFHQSAEALPGIMDTIANVSNATKESVQGLQLALSAVGPVAYGIGITFTDTATALGIFANNGLQGSDAGTSLKTMLLNLEPSTKAQVAAFKELGIITFDQTNVLAALDKLGLTPVSDSIVDQVQQLHQAVSGWDGLTKQTKEQKDAWTEAQKSLGLMNNAFFDANGSAKSMRDIFEILKVATANMTDEQKINVLQTAFGTDAVRAALIAANEGAAGWDNVTEAMSKMGGTQVAAEQRNQGLAGSMKQLGGSFETIQIQVGSLFLPVLTKLADGLTGLLNGFLSLDDGTKTTIVAIVGIAGAAAGLLAGFILLGPVLGAAGAAFGIIGAAIAPLLLPIAAIGVAVALLYAAWQTNFGGIRDVTEQVGVAIQPALTNIQNFVSALAAELGPALAGIQAALAPFITALSNDLTPVLAGLPGAVRLLGDAFNLLGPPLQSVFEIIRLLATGDFRGGIFGLEEDSGLVAFFLGLHDAIALFFDAVLKLLNGDFQGAWNSLWNSFTTVLQTAFTAEGQLLELIGGAIVSFLQAIPGWVAQNVPGMWQALLDEFSRLPSQVQPAWDAFAGWFGGVLGGIPQFVGDMAGDVWAALRGAFDGLVGQLQPAWDGFAGWLGGVLGGIPQFVGDMAGDVWAALRGAFDGLVGQLQPAWDTFAGWLGAVVGGIAQFVSDNMGDIFGGLAGAFSGLVDLLSPAWDVFAGWLAAVVGGIGQFVIDNMGDIWGGLVTAFNGMVAQLQPAWDAFAGWFGSVLAGIPQFVADNIGNVWGALIAALTGSTPGGATGDGGTGLPGGTPPAPGDATVFVTLLAQLAPLFEGMVSATALLTNAITGLSNIMAASVGVEVIGTAGGAGAGITGPLVSIGTLNVGSVAEQDAFLQQMADAILAAAQRVSAPPPTNSPFLP